MILSFKVGSTDQHTVTFSLDQFRERLSITVDGQSVLDTVRFLPVQAVKSYEFEVGTAERHLVRIEKHRDAIWPPFRPQPIFAYVDGVLVAQTEGRISN